MATRYDLYVRQNTPVHRLDARVKLIGISLGIIVALLISNLFWLLAYFVVSCFLIMLTRVSWEKLSHVVYPLMLPVTIMISILYPLTSPPVGQPVLLDFWIIKITLPNVLTGLAMAVRIDTMTFVSYVLIFTTTQRDLVRALEHFGLSYRYGLLISSAFRYLPAFEDIINKITEAQKSRGLDLQKAGFMRRIRNYIPLLTSTMITSLKLADQLGIALMSRAFGASSKRTTLTDLKMRPIDGGILGVLVLLFAAFLAARFWLQVFL